LLAAGLGYSNYDELGAPLAQLPFPRNLKIPFETTELWRILYNKFNIDFQFQRKLLSPIAGLLAGLLMVSLGYIIAKIKKTNQILSSSVYTILFITIISGAILSPTILLVG